MTNIKFVKILVPSERELYASEVPKLYFRAPIWRTIKQLKPTRHLTMKELYRICKHARLYTLLVGKFRSHCSCIGTAMWLVHA